MTEEMGHHPPHTTAAQKNRAPLPFSMFGAMLPRDVPTGPHTMGSHGGDQCRSNWNALSYTSPPRPRAIQHTPSAHTMLSSTPAAYVHRNDGVHTLQSPKVGRSGYHHTHLDWTMHSACKMVGMCPTFPEPRIPFTTHHH